MRFLRPIALIAAALLAACSPGKRQETATAEGGVTVIRFATDWRAQAEHGGYYEALANGEYSKRGLDVRIVQGGPGVNVPQLLTSGAVDLGMGSNSFIVLNLARQGAPVKAVAAFFQKDPQVLMAHPGQGVNTIGDLKGRPILLSDASVGAFWPWLKSKYGFSDDQIRKYTFNSAPFLADKRVAEEGYVTSEPYTIEKQSGMKPVVFLLADNGYPGYANMVLAPEALIAKNPAAVQAFVEATAKGWRDYLHGDPKPADALIRKENPEMTQDILDQARDKMRTYGLVDSGEARTTGPGAMTDTRWEGLFNQAVTEGLYPASLDYRRAYSLQFLGK